jgi:hypothetical protein
MQGYHGTIFAYGQTGSGKTYTMEGNQRQTGITQRSVHELFARISEMKQQEPQRHYSVFVSYLQIYNEKVYDLLNPNSVQPHKKGGDHAGLRIRWTKKDQFVVENLYVFETETYTEVLDLFKYGA